MKPLAIIATLLLTACGGSGDGTMTYSTECHNDTVAGVRVCNDTEKGQTP